MNPPDAKKCAIYHISAFSLPPGLLVETVKLAAERLIQAT
ncbi:hypothetical protein CSC17_2952 [Klebsiella oxytoca]|nr:hypothetical protein CSC17_2952 [Klebsiella oxytoca]EUC85626.1 hypothetical protein HMPREF1570_0928 [Klebsiella oxytoca KA-2]EUC88489.1 hypothetical protein HMPREF1569_2730 [Klebsiella oxytoca OK-1]